MFVCINIIIGIFNYDKPITKEGLIKSQFRGLFYGDDNNIIGSEVHGPSLSVSEFLMLVSDSRFAQRNRSFTALI